MTKPASKVKSTLTPSWSLIPEGLELIKTYAEQVIIIALLPGLVLDLGVLLRQRHMTIPGSALLAIGLVWTIGSVAASVCLQLAAVRGKAISTAECYNESWKYILRIIGFTVLFGILLTVGLILLIVPGLIVLRRYLLAPLYIVEEDLTIREAMRKSAAQTKPVASYIWGIIGVSIVIFAAGGIVGAILAFIPGAPIILSTLASLVTYFLRPLRYKEITKLAVK